MSKFVLIAGILFAAAGVALTLMVFFSPGPMQIYTITMETAAIFLVGGVLTIGVGSLIDAMAKAGARSIYAEAPPAAAAVETPSIPQFGRRVEASAAAPAAAASEEAAPISKEVSDTIAAIEQAKTDIEKAFGEGETKVEAAAPAEAAAAEAAPVEEVLPEEAELAQGEEQLYVVDERVIRGRPARVLSDGTVEAETDEGWMRFENLEHLNEYLDAMSPVDRA